MLRASKRNPKIYLQWLDLHPQPICLQGMIINLENNINEGRALDENRFALMMDSYPC